MQNVYGEARSNEGERREHTRSKAVNEEDMLHLARGIFSGYGYRCVDSNRREAGLVEAFLKSSSRVNVNARGDRHNGANGCMSRKPITMGGKKMSWEKLKYDRTSSTKASAGLTSATNAGTVKQHTFIRMPTPLYARSMILRCQTSSGLTKCLFSTSRSTHKRRRKVGKGNDYRTDQEDN